MKQIVNKGTVIFLSALAFATQPFSANASEESNTPQERAVIHFADLGGIKNWRAVGDDTLEIEGRNGDWYQVELWSHCYGLRSANSIAFVTEPNGDLDRFSSIYVGRGERCQFKTFERIDNSED